MSTLSLGGTPLLAPKKLTSTSATDLWVATKKTWIERVIVSEMAGGTPTLSLTLFDGTTSYFIRNKALTAGETWVFDYGFPLPPGWKLRATAGTANQIDVTVVYLVPDANVS